MADIDYDAMIAGYYQEMELDIIASMKRNFSRHIKDEEDVGFDFPQWQAIKLKELKRYQRQNQRIIAGVGNKVSKKVSEHMLSELAQGSKKEMKRYKDIMGDSYQSSVLMKDSFFRINDRKVNALIGALTNDLSDANYAALRMVNDTYRDVIFKASLFAANGVKTPKQAIDMATKDFLERGINCIEYKNGRRVNIASYAQMAVRTAGKRAYLMGEGERRHALGVPFVKISRHGTSCKLCKPFEGKVLIDDVYSGGTASDGKYMLLSQAMAQGLFHPNCRHGCSTHDPRDDDDDYDEPQREDSDGEALKEESAYAQRMVQRYKRLSAGSLDPENVARYSAKLREWEERKAELDVAISEKGGIIKSEDTIVNGSNVVGEFQHRDNFDSLIDDIVDYQGYNGAPKIISEQSEFDEFVQKDHFLAERTLRADNEEDLRKYLNQLLCEDGEDYFYVNCGVGGAQYGQGMYCAADYSKGNINFSQFKHEIEQYGKMDNANCYVVKWLTLDESAKILELPYGVKASEFISDKYCEFYVRKFSKASPEIIDRYFYLMGQRYKVSASEYDSIMAEISQLKNSIGNDIFKKAFDSTMYFPDGAKYPKMKDPGVLAAEMGFDAINAQGHGSTESYTVILNRTKVIFYGGNEYEYKIK